MGKYNIKSIRRKVLKSRSFNKQASKKINQSLAKARSIMMSDFDNHPISKELSQGPDGRNSSSTLGGYGNLFSFIGFDSSEDPVGEVRKLLMRYPRLSKGRMGNSKIVFTISIPSLIDFAAISKMPWEGGRSWVTGVEVGISGFSSYMYGMFGSSKKSRSGKAIQADRQIRADSFKPMPYMSNIIKRLVTNITAGI